MSIRARELAQVVKPGDLLNPPILLLKSLLNTDLVTRIPRSGTETVWYATQTLVHIALTAFALPITGPL